MRLKASLAILAGLNILASGGAAAQKQDAKKSDGSTRSVQSSQGVPEVKEAAPGTGNSGMMSGDKPFTLSVDRNVGEMSYIFDQDTHELEKIHAKRGVIFASQDMTLNADDFEYQAVNSSVVATGKRVVVRMGEMIVTCQLFKYNPQTQEGQFLGGPILYNRDKNGKVTSTAGKAISVFNQNGKFQMNVQAGGGTPTYMRSAGAESTEPLEKKELAPGQKPAIMTFDSKGSPVQAPKALSGEKTEKSSTDNSLIPAPDLSKSGQDHSSKSGKINPDNPADVQKLSGDSKSK